MNAAIAALMTAYSAPTPNAAKNRNPYTADRVGTGEHREPRVPEQGRDEQPPPTEPVGQPPRAERHQDRGVYPVPRSPIQSVTDRVVSQCAQHG